MIFGNGGLLDITYDTFLRTPGFTKYLTNFKERGFGIWFADGTVQPYKKNKNHIEENKFKMYVTDNEYFTANFTPFSITNTLSTDYKKNPYLIAIIAAYVSTYVCGISTQHMEFSNDTPGIITSMVRYHLYYQIIKFLKDPSKLDRYIAHVPNTIKRHKPTAQCGPMKLTKVQRKLTHGLARLKMEPKLEITSTTQTHEVR